MPELVQRKDDGGTHSSLLIFSPAVKVMSPAAPTAAASTAAKNNFPLTTVRTTLATYILVNNQTQEILLIECSS